MSEAAEKQSQAALRLVFLGSARKTVLFEKLCQAARKYERHAAYPDMHYLTIPFREKNTVIELNDPGLAHTGGREMAIREADIALLFYSESSTASFEMLSEMPALFERRKHACPMRIICDLDEDEAEGNSSGYESDPAIEGRLPRRESMERMRRATEDGRVEITRGEHLASEMGPAARLLRMSVDDFSSPVQLLQELLEEASRVRSSSKGIAKAFHFGAKKRNKSQSEKGENGTRTPEKVESRPPSGQDNHSSVSSEKEKDKQSRKNPQSKMCSIM